jgi:hypothetical protein
MSKTGKFFIKKITDMKTVEVGTELPESDYSVMSFDDRFIQMEYKEQDKIQEEYVVHPGLYSITKTPEGLKLHHTEFVNDSILETFSNTKKLEFVADAFFSKFDIYKKYGIEIPKRAILMYGSPGCHAKGTKVILFSGEKKNVEDIEVGDLLMGPDSLPRKVLAVGGGREKMVKIIPTKGESFIVNYNHILHLTASGKSGAFKSPINLSFSNYENKLTKSLQEKLKLTKSSGIDFKEQEQPISPYILGCWLGDGHSPTMTITSMDKEIINEWILEGNKFDLHPVISKKTNSKARNYNLSSAIRSHVADKNGNKMLTIFKDLNLIENKHIPKKYLLASKNQRLELLAGLIDTDGGYYETFTFYNKNEKLVDDVVFLARSLGFGCYKTQYIGSCVYKGEVKKDTYFRVNISGNLDLIPTRLERKKATARKQIKNVNRIGFKYEILPEDDYYGFTLDKDHLYLTDDFFIHHNTGKTSSLQMITKRYVADGETIAVIWSTDKFEASFVKDFIKSFSYDSKIKKMILIAEDIGGSEIDQVKMRSESSLLSLLDNKEKTFKVPILIFGTTNHPEVFMGSLTNRPDRFDDKIEVGFPTAEQRLKLIQFFLKDRVTPEMETLIQSNRCAEFTPAHIRDIPLRMDLFDKTGEKVIVDLCDDLELFKKNFSKKKTMGFGMYDED